MRREFQIQEIARFPGYAPPRLQQENAHQKVLV